MYGDELSYDEDEAFEFLRKLMPQGFAGPDVQSVPLRSARSRRRHLS